MSFYQNQPLPRRMIRDMAAEDRPQARARSAGINNLSTAELLALVLQAPDALDMAREMLDRSGSLLDLYRAETAVLERLRGVGAARAMQVKAALELGRRSMLPHPRKRQRVTSPESAATLLLPEMAALLHEQVRVILLDTRNRVIDVVMIYQGSLNTAVVRIGEIFRPAIIQSAAAIIMAHNHPSNDPSPSPQDISITRSISAIGEKIDIPLLDHVIVTANGFVSLKERGYM